MERADLFFKVGVEAFSKCEYAVAAHSFLVSLQLRESVCGKYHADVAETYAWLGKSYWYDMQFALAPDAFRRCYDILLQRPDIVPANDDHSRKMIETWIVKTFKVNGITYGSAYLEVVKISSQNQAAGDALLQQNKTAEAIEYFEKAQEMEQSWLLMTGIRPSLELADLHFKLAYIHAQDNSLDQSMSHYTKALSHYRCMQEATTVVSSAVNVAAIEANRVINSIPEDTMQQQHKPMDSAAILRMSSTKASKPLTTYHRYVMDTCREIAKIHQSMGYSKAQIKGHLHGMMSFTPEECLLFALADQKKASEVQEQIASKVHYPVSVGGRNGYVASSKKYDDATSDFDSEEDRFQDILSSSLPPDIAAATGTIARAPAQVVPFNAATTTAATAAAVTSTDAGVPRYIRFDATNICAFEEADCFGVCPM
eukprot:CAMPEP_0119568710 /NCGR_PEP_ID=MMETSP1352-20130426/39612_1 /TAXON_ID=265584 /ORGANISM="Stauroneis constricta, Strain CCMP1120" /LENGTH=425 /DNA_ID=CAMNT_0007618155 /DNA_START=165 /DNA_END=1442 /DNA_ORIENTATION=+